MHMPTIHHKPGLTARQEACAVAINILSLETEFDIAQAGWTVMPTESMETVVVVLSREHSCHRPTGSPLAHDIKPLSA